MDLTLNFSLPADPRFDIGDLWFVFTFRQVGSRSWRVYIDNRIDYRGRPIDAHSTHRLGGPDHPYICWSSTIPTLADAERVAALWAECTAHYIATGRFENPGRPQHRRTEVAAQQLGSRDVGGLSAIRRFLRS